MTTVQSDISAIEYSGLAHPRAGTALVPLPPWVKQALEGTNAGKPRHFQREVDGVGVTVRDAGTLAMCSACISDAAGLSTAELRSAVARTYSAIFRAADELAARNRVRMWSFIPDIHGRREDGLTTYHVFNQGRFEAFEKTLGSDLDFAGRLPTATGIGHDGPHLSIHCLTSVTPGIHIENPRQVPAYRYSTRYGPRPPCFARGTILTGTDGALLLVGGTASVRNEVSMHPDNVEAQVAETFENLFALAAAAMTPGCAQSHPLADVPSVGGSGAEGVNPTGAEFTHLRVYFSDPGCEQMLREEVRRRIGPNADIELVAARVCREDLLVEIEGVLELPGTG